MTPQMIGDELVGTRAAGISIILVGVIVLTIAQVTIKARLSSHGVIPFELRGLLRYGLVLLRDWQFIAAGLGLIVASVCWYAGVSRVPLGQAFGLAALTYPLIFLGAIFILHEPLTWQGIVGNLAIVVGIVLIANP